MGDHNSTQSGAGIKEEIINQGIQNPNENRGNNRIKYYFGFCLHEITPELIQSIIIRQVNPIVFTDVFLMIQILFTEINDLIIYNITNISART